MKFGIALTDAPPTSLFSSSIEIWPSGGRLYKCSKKKKTIPVTGRGSL
jgi:hypothetical protein